MTFDLDMWPLTSSTNEGSYVASLPNFGWNPFKHVEGIVPNVTTLDKAIPMCLSCPAKLLKPVLHGDVYFLFNKNLTNGFLGDAKYMRTFARRYQDQGKLNIFNWVYWRSIGLSLTSVGLLGSMSPLNILPSTSRPWCTSRKRVFHQSVHCMVTSMDWLHVGFYKRSSSISSWNYLYELTAPIIFPSFLIHYIRWPHLHSPLHFK